MFRFVKLLLIVAVLMGSGLAYAKEIWYCPMHPHYTSDRAGLCPICNMNLVKKTDAPKEEHKAAVEGLSQVVLNNQQVQLIGVKTDVVKRAMMVKKVLASGYVSTNHDLYAMQDEYVKTYLEYVTAFRDAKRFAHATRNLETHRNIQLRLHEAEDKLLRFGFGFPEIEKLQKVSWKTPWNQPELLFFKDEFRYWVVAQIFENDRGYLEPGQDVIVDIPAFHEQAKGVIRTIGGTFDEGTRTVNALIELMDYRGELTGNMLVNVTVPVELNESVMVPLDAVMDTGTRKIVYVETAPGVFDPREVQVIAPADNGWAIKSGIKEGDKVVVNGNFLLDSESRIKAPVGASEEHGHGN